MRHAAFASRAPRPTTIAILGVRLLALVLFAAGAAVLIGRGIEWSAAYDKAFRDEFTWSLALPPLIAALLGLVLAALARPLGRRLARGLDPDRR